MKKRFLKLSGLLLLIALFVAGYYLLFKIGIVIPCIFHEITGLYCPGCGITRMFLSLLKLDFYQAFKFNPLIFISLPFIAFFLIDFLIRWLKGINDYSYKKISNNTWIVLLVIVLIYGIIRNIPIFDYLIPTVI